MDTTTGIVIVVLLLLLLVFVASRGGKKEPPSDGGGVKVNFGDGATGGRSTPGGTASRTAGRGQRSLDELHAEAYGMWVCGRCETLNEGSLGVCKVCGARK